MTGDRKREGRGKMGWGLEDARLERWNKELCFCEQKSWDPFLRFNNRVSTDSQRPSKQKNQRAQIHEQLSLWHHLLWPSFYLPLASRSIPLPSFRIWDHSPCSFSAFAHQLLTILGSDCDQELIQTHTSIDSHLSPEKGLDVMFWDGIWCLIVD